MTFQTETVAISPAEAGPSAADRLAGLRRIAESADPQALKNMIAQNGRLRGQMGGRGEFMDAVKDLDAQDRAAMERLRDLGHVSFATTPNALDMPYAAR